MSRLTRDGTAEPVSRDQILRHARGQGNIHFPCSADHEQDWQPYPVDPYSAICDDHTYIHTYALLPSLRQFSSPSEKVQFYCVLCVCVFVCVCVVIPFILDARFVDAPAGVTQEEGHTGFLHLPAAVLTLMFLARRIQLFRFHVDMKSNFVYCRFSRSTLVGRVFFFFFFLLRAF